MTKHTDNYKRPNYNEMRKLQTYFKQMHEAATFFDSYFKGKKVIFTTQDKEISVIFFASNFMHLCGVSYKNGSKCFFDDCVNQRVAVENIMIKKDGTTFQKLQVIGNSRDLITNQVLLTERESYLCLEFDYSLRTRKQILALTLVESNFKYVPQSLINLRCMKVFPKGSPIVKIYAIDLETKEIKIYLEMD